MIICKLLGGLGNQMFQYSIGRYLSLKYNTPLKLDVKELLFRGNSTSNRYYEYELKIFENIEAEIVEYNSGTRIKEPYYHFYPKMMTLNINGDIYLDGYWQSYKYFEDIKDILNKDFIFQNKVPNSIVLEEIKNTNSVMIHVRRTDYLNNDYHGVIDLDYIEKSVSIIEKSISSPKYFVFSDDINWCKNNIKLNNVIFMENQQDILPYCKGEFDLQLMIQCKHYIICNSSFSWWSAWLNNNENKIVISPKKWFNRNINTDDLIPKEWIRI